MTTKSKHKVHFSDGLGPICGIVSEHSIGARSPMFPFGVSCSKCLRRVAQIAGALMKFKAQVEDAIKGS